MGAPNVTQYYRNAIFDQLKYWWTPMKKKQWAHIKQTLLGCNAQSLLEQSSQDTNLHAPLSSIVAATNVWKSVLSLHTKPPILTMVSLQVTSLEHFTVLGT